MPIAFLQLAPPAFRSARTAKSTPRCSLNTDKETPPRYMPKVEPSDPIVTAVAALPSLGGTVTNFEHLDTRWNGNEAYRVDVSTAGAEHHIFAKLNRVEDPSVFMSEAVGLTAMLNSTPTLRALRRLDVGRLPCVGAYGPGAFILLEYIDFAPFGAFRRAAHGVQRALADMLADMHASTSEHGFGFAVSNYLALTPMDNSWHKRWEVFFARRLAKLVSDAFKDKPYGRAALGDEDVELKQTALRIVRGMEVFFEGVEVKPSLLHGDLWIGNVGATKASQPVIYDPACFYGHSEFDLALPRMFEGFSDEFWSRYFERVPKARGFDERAKLYELYQYLNQLNLFGDPDVKRKVFEMANELADMVPAIKVSG